MVHLAQALAVQDRWADALSVLAEVIGAPGLDAEIAAEAAAERALALAQNRDLDDARAAAEEVLAASPAAAPKARSVALQALALCDFFEGHTESGTEILRRSVDVAAASDDLPLRWRNPQMLVGIFLANAGDCDGALTALAEARSEADRWGARWATPACQWYLGFVLYRQGRWDDASDALAQGLDEARWAETTWEEGGLLGTTAVISARQGYLRRAEALVAKLEERPQTVHSDATWQAWARSIVFERRGEMEAALETLERVRRDCLERGVSGSIRGIYPDLCRLALQLGRSSLLESVVAEFDDHARSGPPSSMEAAVSAHCRGIAHRDAAEVGRAVEVYSSGRQDLYLALAFEEMAVVHAEKGSSKRARETLREALSRYEQMKADMDAARARARLRLLKVSSAPIGTSAHAAAALTRTEAAVAELVVEGLQNKEIATRLYVTVGTVQTHLKSIFRKMGVTSRTQLAIALVDETRDEPGIGARR
jgi:DNA-binding NarL/FixJ family response regulator